MSDSRNAYLTNIQINTGEAIFRFDIDGPLPRVRHFEDGNYMLDISFNTSFYGDSEEELYIYFRVLDQNQHPVIEQVMPALDYFSNQLVRNRIEHQGSYPTIRALSELFARYNRAHLSEAGPIEDFRVEQLRAFKGIIKDSIDFTANEDALRTLHRVISQILLETPSICNYLQDETVVRLPNIDISP